MGRLRSNFVNEQFAVIARRIASKTSIVVDTDRLTFHFRRLELHFQLSECQQLGGLLIWPTRMDRACQL